MAYNVMLLPAVDISETTYQQQFEAGIVYAVSRTNSDAWTTVAVDNGKQVFVCGVIRAGRSSDPGGTNSRWLNILAFAQESDALVRGPRLFNGSYIQGHGYSLYNVYNSVYWNYGGSTDVLVTPDNNSYPKFAPNCPIPVYDLSDTYSTSQNISLAAQAIISNIAWGMPPSDPYAGGGTSGPGGGDGTWDYTGDATPHPGEPSLSAHAIGFFKSYVPTTSELAQFAAWLWAPAGFDINTFKKLWADPLSCIISLHIIPTTPTNAAAPVIVGNVQGPTELTMRQATEQFVTTTFGPVTIEPPSGTYLDYSPATKCSLYLPYIGMQTIDVDDIMGKRVTVQYIIDIVTGACSATVETDDGTTKRTLYVFGGNCASHLPITASLAGDIIGALIQSAGAAGQVYSGNALGGAQEAVSAAVQAVKPQFARSGSVSTHTGRLGPQVPYFVWTAPHVCAPEDQDKLAGYPSYITAKLDDVSGYTEVDSIQLQGIACTSDELDEIERLLKSGVIL